MADSCSTTYKGHTVFQHIENYARCVATMCLNVLGQPSSCLTVTAFVISSTKYVTHQRRTGGKLGVEVTFTEYMTLTTTEYILHANVTNTFSFIDMPRCYLQLERCVTQHAHGAADILMAITAQCNPQLPKNNVVILDDTDLVIRLCYYAESVGFD